MIPTLDRLRHRMRYWRLRPRVLKLLTLQIWLRERFRFAEAQQILFWVSVWPPPGLTRKSSSGICRRAICARE